MRYLYRIIRSIIISFGLLYAYNIFMNQFDLPIPINIYTISFTTIFGIPGFIGLIMFYIINFR